MPPCLRESAFVLLALLLEYHQRESFGARRDAGWLCEGLDTESGHDALNSNGPYITGPRALRRQFAERDGGFDRPFVVRCLAGDIPCRVPMDVSGAGFAGPAAMVDGQAIEGGIVSVQVDEKVNSIARGQIGVTRSRSGRFGIFALRRFAAADDKIQELIVIRQHGGGGPGIVVMLSAGQFQLRGALPDRILQISVESRARRSHPAGIRRFRRDAAPMQQPQLSLRAPRPV